jgi:hypothetical protein
LLDCGWLQMGAGGEEECRSVNVTVFFITSSRPRRCGKVPGDKHWPRRCQIRSLPYPSQGPH